MANQDSSSSSVGRLFAIIVWITPVLAVAAGAKDWLPPVASRHGGGIDHMLRFLLITVGGLLLAAHLALGYALWCYGDKTRVSFRLATPKQERNWSLLPIILMALIAEGGVFVLGLPVWADLYSPAPADAVTVQITAEQFAWNMHYPGRDGRFGRTDSSLLSLTNPLGIDRDDPAAGDDIIVTGELHLPVNRPARIRLRSKDVLHSFFLPVQRIKQDVVPGMTIDAWFVPTETGDYEIACTELCGFGHYQMRGLLRVESQEAFDAWLAEMAQYN